jgi:alkylation response protein AidB-like acyl-CoA dehydrogenase
MAADLLGREAAPDVLRAGWPGGDRTLVDAVWRKLADTGALGVLVPEADGGLGLDENALVPLLIELGRSGLPVPAVEAIAVAAPLLAGRAEPAGALGDLLAGRLTVAAALDGGDLVPFGAVAELVLLPAGAAVRAYRADELAVEPLATVDGSRALARVHARGAGTELGPLEPAWRHGVLGTAALLVGLARRMLELTVGYVREREQYGVPIGSFQAVKHALASALVAVEFAEPAVLAAAWAQSAGTGERETSLAKVLAADAAQLVARTAIQCHGAMGYTTEYDLHLYAKRVWALAPSWGDAASHRARLADALEL